MTDHYEVAPGCTCGCPASAVREWIHHPRCPLGTRDPAPALLPLVNAATGLPHQPLDATHWQLPRCEDRSGLISELPALFPADAFVHDSSIKVSFRTTTYRAYGKDHPTAGGRAPQPGDEIFALTIPLIDGSTLEVELGPQGRADLLAMLLAEQAGRASGR